MNFMRPFAISIALLVSPALVQAQTPVTYSVQGEPVFSISVPDFWLVRTGGPRDIEDTQLGDTRAVSRVIGLRPEADDGVWMGLVSPASVGTIQEGISYLVDIERFLVNTPEISGRSSARIGGRPAEVVRGTGRRNGRGISFTAAVIDLPGPRVAVAVAILAGDADAGFVEDLNDIFASFRVIQ